MSVPVGQMMAVLRHVAIQRLRGNDRYPLVLMLEPLFRCNLACGGCGKIQHPTEVLRSHLTPEQCFAAVEECGAPMVSIPGGEPLLHPQIVEIVEGIVARRRYLYLCTNAIKLEEMLPLFRPSPYLAFSVHLDGPREEHDHAVCREGVYDMAVLQQRGWVTKLLYEDQVRQRVGTTGGYRRLAEVGLRCVAARAHSRGGPLCRLPAAVHPHAEAR